MLQLRDEHMMQNQTKKKSNVNNQEYTYTRKKSGAISSIS